MKRLSASFKLLDNLFENTDKTIVPTPFNWLYSSAPNFKIKGDQIAVLHEPKDFYNELLERCSTSQNRIIFSSLYLGCGSKEEKLVSVIESRLKNTSSNLQVSILLDANRGSRGEKNSRHILLPLLLYQKNCQVSLFHSPNLRGPLKQILPARFNELLGLQHMKFYIFDDSVLITGANLSHDYFTNRQDRYILILNCKPLADFLAGLVECVSQISFQLDQDNNVSLPEKSKFHPFNDSKEEYVKAGHDLIWNYFVNSMQSEGTPAEEESENDTVIFPLLEMPPFDIHHDSVVTKHLLDMAPAGAEIHLATGYFNLTNEYVDSLVNQSKAAVKILMAHPTANGFLNAAGVAGGVPYAYTTLASNFLHNIERHQATNRIQIFEFLRSGWTFHSKGLWYTLPQESTPHLTLIGSSNFGSRSVTKDLEMQVAIVTTNSKLREVLAQERDRLYQSGLPFTREVADSPSRRSPLWVRSTSRIFKNYF
nr:PREDICTED: CDP-diacylglycerol--glycerol-3-phosphate 3-phosphatidyltransferase, mitochondrial [Bemisia tabaci]